jgi:hypothetical protein
MKLPAQCGVKKCQFRVNQFTHGSIFQHTKAELFLALLLKVPMACGLTRTGRADNGEDFEYRMVIRTSDDDKFSALARYLRASAQIKTFRISPTGD